MDSPLMLPDTISDTDLSALLATNNTNFMVSSMPNVAEPDDDQAFVLTLNSAIDVASDKEAKISMASAGVGPDHLPEHIGPAGLQMGQCKPTHASHSNEGVGPSLLEQEVVEAEAALMGKDPLLESNQIGTKIDEPAVTPKAKGRRRPKRSMPCSTPEERERRERFLERNRLAAMKCRKRRREEEQELAAKHNKLENQYSELQMDVAALETELNELISLALAHRDCHDPGLKEWIAQHEATKKQKTQRTIDGVAMSPSSSDVAQFPVAASGQPPPMNLPSQKTQKLQATQGNTPIRSLNPSELVSGPTGYTVSQVPRLFGHGSHAAPPTQVERQSSKMHGHMLPAAANSSMRVNISPCQQPFSPGGLGPFGGGPNAGGVPQVFVGFSMPSPGVTPGGVGMRHARNDSQMSNLSLGLSYTTSKPTTESPAQRESRESSFSNFSSLDGTPYIADHVFPESRHMALGKNEPEGDMALFTDLFLDSPV